MSAVERENRKISRRALLGGGAAGIAVAVARGEDARGATAGYPRLKVVTLAQLFQARADRDERRARKDSPG